MSMSKRDNKSKRNELKAAFDVFDKNGDGSISSSELCGIMRTFGYYLNDQEAHDLIGENDVNGDGEIDFEEFVEMMTRKPEDDLDMIWELKKTFRFFDKNGDGQISAQELRESLSSLGEVLSEEEAKEMLREADTNGDGYLNFEEFANVMAI
jgi:calmodulin